MKIVVSTLSGSINETLDVQPDSSIDDVLKMIEKKINVSSVYLTLVFSDIVLERGFALNDYAVSDQNRLLLVLKSGWKKMDKSTITVYVRYEDESDVGSFSVEPGDTVASLKRKISEVGEIPVFQQHLSFVGTSLVDNRTLSFYNIVDGCSIVFKRIRRFSVKCFDDDSLSGCYDLGGNHTVLALKQKIQETKGIPIEKQVLAYHDQFLVEGESELPELIGSQPIVLKVRTKSMVVMVTQPDSRTDGRAENLFSVDPNDTILMLKNMIEKKNGYPVEQQRIHHYGCEVLPDDCTFSQRNITDCNSFPLRVELDTTMKIFVKYPDEDSLDSYDVKPEDFTQSLKTKIQMRKGIFGRQQILLFSGNQLKNDHKFEEYQVKKESTIELSLKQCKRAASIDVVVAMNDMDSESTLFSVHPKDDILELCDMICESEGIPVGKQVLTFMDKILVGGHTFEDYRIKHSSRIVAMRKSSVDSMILFVKLVYSERIIVVQVQPNNSVEGLKEIIQHHTGIPPDQQRLLMHGRQLEGENKLSDYPFIVDGSTLMLVLRLRGKPVILFYPPTSGKFAQTSTFRTKTTVILNKACRFTTLLPRPSAADESGRSVLWDATVHKNKHNDPDQSALLTVDGHCHAYLFWEAMCCCGTAEEIEMDSRIVGYKSVVDHAEDAYVLNGMEEYDEWCHLMLGTLGLNTREQDDFTTFWARSVFEHGPIVVARVVPEADLVKSAELHVSVSDCEVRVDVRRVYVTMIVCKVIPKDLCSMVDKMRKWKHGLESIELPSELKSTYPIVRDPNAMTVIEWGGVLEVA